MEPKKSPEADLEKKKGLFLQIGLVVSLAVTLVAFEWKSYDKVEYDLGQLKVEDVPEEIIPITKQEEKPPPPPPPPAQIINVVKDDVKIENEAEIQETEVTQETVVEVQPIKEEVIDEPEIFLIVEEMPSFPGGEGQLVKYLSENIKYPAIARENNITGTVFVTFVVGPDGSVKDVKVLRGIGGGCDEEAKRVVMAMPKWKAGKQRGKSVSVQYNLPIRFTLK
ncbi:MAG: TonB family protein [Bacteroidia bacterium]|nr:TonB family protein [Bacteroidota bacterium]MBP9081445.1 TonB family protein [Bacteroidia bacterium]MBK7390673.1 TonB family protein [Bacteroidota bacterium]MBK8872898.1 TonB family protein [Bacteroidota bacterium]MBK9047251.1 TonB family protein [Bacteroidota bacterium]